MEKRLDGKIEGVGTRLDSKLDKLARSLTTAQSWAFALYIALATAMFGTMARGFGWI